MTDAVRELQAEVRELRTAVVELRSEAGQYRAETEQLRKELQATRGAVPEAPLRPRRCVRRPAPLEERVSSLEESSQLLSSKLDDQYQTKVEAASKYRVRLSGIVLLNLFSNHGHMDSQETPTWAIPDIPNVSGQTLAPPCGNRRSASKCLVRAWPGPGPRETCNSIFREDLRTLRME